MKLWVYLFLISYSFFAMDRMSMMRSAAQKGDVNDVANRYLSSDELYACIHLALENGHRDFWCGLIATGTVPAGIQEEVLGIANTQYDDAVFSVVWDMIRVQN